VNGTKNVATAVPSGSGAPITAKLEFEKPPLLRLKEYHWERTITVDGFWGIPEPGLAPIWWTGRG